MIMSRTRAVVRRISQQATRPLASEVRTRRWDTTALSVPASIARTCWPWCGGKKSMMRLTVSGASIVWSVESTRCPVSAADSAVATVSSSRISPTRITSGSWRSTRRSARLNELVSCPTSRWLMIERLSRWRNSIGSSIVTMCFEWKRLIWSIIAASVDDLPEPVVPVRRMMPRSSSAICEITSGRPSCSIERISCGIARQTSEMTPRWRKALTRKRERPLTPNEKSTSFSSVNSSSLCLSLPIRSARTVSVSSGVSGSEPGIGSRRPWSLMSGCEGTFRWRSEPSTSMTRRRAGSSSNMRVSSDARVGDLRPERAYGRQCSGDVAELLGFGEALQLLQRLVLDLADPLARDVERAAHLVERARVFPAEPVAQLQHAALAVREVLERLAQRLLGEDLGGAVVGRLGALVGDELAELRLLLVADRLLERHRRLRRALDRVDLVGLDPGHVRDLLGGRLATQLGDELALGPADLVQLLDHVHGDADRARLVGERAGDGLADPPRRVRRELEALAVVELLGGTHEAERALLDQAEEGKPLVAVVLRDRDHEAQVRLDHLLLGVEVAALDALGEVDLLLGREQAHLADVLQEELKGIGRHVRLQVDRRLRLAAPALAVRGALDLSRRDGRIDLLDEFDLRLLEEPVEILDVGLVEVDLGERQRDLRVGQHARRRALGNEELYLLEFLQFNY